MIKRRYSELKKLRTFEERYKYLKLNGVVGQETFGVDRYLNQNFYRSTQWRSIRNLVIARDEGCNLGIPGYDIYDRVYVHHMNPMIPEDILEANDEILNPDFLISVTHYTHNAIHYGDERLLPKLPVERRPGDTKIW